MTNEPTVTADVEAARVALPEAAFSMAVFEPLERAKAYVGALSIMSLDQGLDDHFSGPMYRLVSDVGELLDEIQKEVERVWRLGRKAVGGLPDLPDDGNGEVEEAAAVT